MTSVEKRKYLKGFVGIFLHFDFDREEAEDDREGDKEEKKEDDKEDSVVVLPCVQIQPPDSQAIENKEITIKQSVAEMVYSKLSRLDMRVRKLLLTSVKGEQARMTSRLGP